MTFRCENRAEQTAGPHGGRGRFLIAGSAYGTSCSTRRSAFGRGDAVDIGLNHDRDEDLLGALLLDVPS